MRKTKTIIIFANHDNGTLPVFFENTIETLSGRGNVELAFETPDRSSTVTSMAQSAEWGIAMLREQRNKIFIEAKARPHESLIQTQIEQLDYRISCFVDSLRILRSVEAHQKHAVTYGIKTHSAEPVYSGDLTFLNLLRYVVPLRNEDIAANILRTRKIAQKKEDILQIVMLGPAHYEVMYELLAQQSSDQLIEDQFCFLHLYKDIVFPAFKSDISAEREVILPFKVALIDINQTTPTLSQQAVLNSLDESSSSIGNGIVEFIQPIKEYLEKIKADALPVEHTLKRAEIIKNHIVATEEKYRGLDTNLSFNIIIQLWAFMDIRTLNSTSTVGLEAFLGRTGTELKPYEVFLQRELPQIIIKLKEAQLFNTIKQGEFTSQPSHPRGELRMLKKRLPQTPPLTPVSEDKPDSLRREGSCISSRSFFKVAAVVATGAVLTSIFAASLTLG